MAINKIRSSESCHVENKMFNFFWATPVWPVVPVWYPFKMVWLHQCMYVIWLPTSWHENTKHQSRPKGQFGFQTATGKSKTSCELLHFNFLSSFGKTNLRFKYCSTGLAVVSIARTSGYLFACYASVCTVRNHPQRFESNWLRGHTDPLVHRVNTPDVEVRAEG